MNESQGSLGVDDERLLGVGLLARAVVVITRTLIKKDSFYL